MDIKNILQSLKIQDHNHGVMIGTESFGSGPTIDSISPVDGKKIASLSSATPEEYDRAVVAAQKAYHEWKTIPAPKRGEVVRQFGDALREKKDALGALVSYEMGKSPKKGSVKFKR
jgi:aldehyde dehydrogenase (NAD+)